jgi:hypothetical protein
MKLPSVINDLKIKFKHIWTFCLGTLAVTGFLALTILLFGVYSLIAILIAQLTFFWHLYGAVLSPIVFAVLCVLMIFSAGKLVEDLSK